MSLFDLPPHPGELLRVELIWKRRLTIDEVAPEIGCSSEELEDLFAQRRSLTQVLAAKLEGKYQISADELLNAQRAYDRVRRPSALASNEAFSLNSCESMSRRLKPC